MATMKKKINWKDMALGAGSLAVLMVIPKIGDFLSKSMASVRDKLVKKR